MFDAPTEQLIRHSPKLSSFDTSTLPQTLTEAFTKIVLLALKPSEDATTDANEKLLRLAAVYEALVNNGTHGVSQKAAAFVAGTAYRLLSDTSPKLKSRDANLLLGKSSIDVRVAAPLLFLIAEQFPDAREARRGLIGKWHGNYVRAALIESLHDLAKENLHSIIERAGRLALASVCGEAEHTCQHML